MGLKPDGGGEIALNPLAKANGNIKKKTWLKANDNIQTFIMLHL
jgi:hypothetical protein